MSGLPFLLHNTSPEKRNGHTVRQNHTRPRNKSTAIITVVVDGEYEHVAGFGVFGDVSAHHPVLAAVDQLVGVVGQFADADAVGVATRDAERQAAHVQLTGLGDLHQVLVADPQRLFRERVTLEEGGRQPGADARHAVLGADHDVPAFAHQAQRFGVVVFHVVAGRGVQLRRRRRQVGGQAGQLRCGHFQLVAVSANKTNALITTAVGGGFRA